MTTRGYKPKPLRRVFIPKKNGKTYSNKVNLVRYADDFIVTGDTMDVLEEIKSELIVFLKDRGLELSEEKTLITHVLY